VIDRRYVHYLAMTKPTLSQDKDQECDSEDPQRQSRHRSRHQAQSLKTTSLLWWGFFAWLFKAWNVQQIRIIIGCWSY